MNFLEVVKDAVKIAQKCGNIELYKQLLDLSAMAIDIQNENSILRQENAELKRTRDMENDIEYHMDAYVSRKTDSSPIKYCVACWASKRSLVTLQWDGTYQHICPLCKAKIVIREKAPDDLVCGFQVKVKV